MEKMKMESRDGVQSNIDKIAEIFPNCITESLDLERSTPEKPAYKKAINWTLLRQVLSSEIIDENEAYEMTWVGKKNSILEAHKPIRKTLRPDIQNSLSWDTTQNIYIEGENLDCLKLLQESYLGKIDLIYIDPPYNTGNDSFLYPDDFSISRDDYLEKTMSCAEGYKMYRNTETNGRFHSDWCSMIYSRLLLARNVLKDNGVIFISIDDNEVENLKKIGNEVFGEENFIGCLSVENNPKGRKNSAFISVSSEYCLIFAKNKKEAYFVENVPKKSSDMTLDENGKYVHNSGKRVLVGENSFNNYVVNPASEKNYSVYYRKSDNSLILETEDLNSIRNDLIEDGYRKYFSFNKGKLVENTYTKEKFLELHSKGALQFSQDKIYEKNFADTIRIKSQLVNKEYEAIVHGVKKKYSMELTTTGAGTYLKRLFDLPDSPFVAPKNIGFIKLLISLINNKDAIILDFFSGSSTTADAVMRLNAEDGGNRSFIMVQLPEKCDSKSIPFKYGYKTISEIGRKRIELAAQDIEQQDPLLSQSLDLGYRLFKIDSSNFNEVFYNPVDLKQGKLFDIANNIKEDRSDLDLFFGCILDWGLPLSLPYNTEIIDGYKVHDYNNGDLIACFDENVSEELVKEIASRQPIRTVFRDSSFENSPGKINVFEIFKKYMPEDADDITKRVKVI